MKMYYIHKLSVFAISQNFPVSPPDGTFENV